MKIAIYYHIDFSGAKRLVYEHVNYLRKFGHKVDIYTTDSEKDIFDPAIAASNKYYYKFNPRKINMPVINRIKNDFIDTFFTLKKLNKKIARDIDKKKYDLVLVHTDIRTQAPYILRYLKTLSVYYCLEPLRNSHEYSLRIKDNISFINKIYERMNRYIRKQIDLKNTLSAKKIITISLFARERIIAVYDLYPEIMYPGVNTSVFKPVNKKKKNQILFVADKLPIYGYDLADHAIKLVPKKIRPKLKIVSWKKNNKQRLSDDDLVNLYNESIAVLSLSRLDTFGLIPLEAMACGVPVIALNVAGYREILINNKTGYLVDFKPEEIAEKIIKLIKNPDLSKRIGDNGRRFAIEKWSWEKQAKKLENYLINNFDNK